MYTTKESRDTSCVFTGFSARILSKTAKTVQKSRQIKNAARIGQRKREFAIFFR
jgi:hypothetical protein